MEMIKEIFTGLLGAIVWVAIVTVIGTFITIYGYYLLYKEDWKGKKVKELIEEVCDTYGPILVFPFLNLMIGLALLIVCWFRCLKNFIITRKPKYLLKIVNWINKQLDRTL